MSLMPRKLAVILAALSHDVKLSCLSRVALRCIAAVSGMSAEIVVVDGCSVAHSSPLVSAGT